MWVFRRKLVRIHQEDPVPPVEGVLVGKPWRCGGHYVVRKPAVVASVDQTVSSEAYEAWVPREKVIMIEVMRR